jgi:hypothetical protein
MNIYSLLKKIIKKVKPIVATAKKYLIIKEIN